MFYFALQANVADYSDNQWVTCFQESAELLLGKTAAELGDLRESVSVLGIHLKKFKRKIILVIFQDFMVTGMILLYLRKPPKGTPMFCKYSRNIFCMQFNPFELPSVCDYHEHGSVKLFFSFRTRLYLIRCSKMPCSSPTFSDYGPKWKPTM